MNSVEPSFPRVHSSGRCCFHSLIFFLLINGPLCLFSFYELYAQAGMWTWMKGDSLANQPGNFGLQGVPAPTNNPPGLYGPSKWVDLQGNFWIFGGVGPGGSYNDLWRFEPATGNWTWMKGAGVPGDPGSYGTIGIPSPTNNPGCRGYGAASWTDLNGNLWLYAGTGSTPTWGGALADLWKYDPLTNEWTWMKGDPGDMAVFGTLQVPAPANTPGMRDECTANWVDAGGSLWLFGSKRNNAITTTDDMWKYDVAINQWTWMSGSSGNNNVNPNYGTQHVFSATSTPGSRMNHGGWTASDGTFYLYGGLKFFGDYYADLWRYDPSITQWSWESGTQQPNGPGSSGPLCDTSQNFHPSYRFENRSTWVDAQNNLWLYGGASQGDMSDLWIYDTDCYVWSWVKGSVAPNKKPVRGTLGIPAAGNTPGGRMGSVSFEDMNGNFWLFAGRAASISVDLNDLWMFTPDPDCPGAISCQPQPVFLSASDTSLCEKFCIDFFDESLNTPVGWEWIFEGGSPSVSLVQHPAGICYDDPGTYDVTLITTDASGNTDTLFMDGFITVFKNPFAPAITQNGNLLTSSPASSYQWQLNGTDIPGATSQEYEITQSGLYTIIITDANGCIAQSSIKAVFVGVHESAIDPAIQIHPNPSDGNFRIEFPPGMAGAVRVTIRQADGLLVFDREFHVSGPAHYLAVHLAPVPGTYIVQIRAAGFTTQRLVEVSP